MYVLHVLNTRVCFSLIFLRTYVRKSLCGSECLHMYMSFSSAPYRKCTSSGLPTNLALSVPVLWSSVNLKNVQISHSTDNLFTCCKMYNQYWFDNHTLGFRVSAGTCSSLEYKRQWIGAKYS